MPSIRKPAAQHKVTPNLAKLTRPKLYGTVPRTRLFAELDERRRRPVVWIAAPPGAGKTTLVASYLDAREVPCLWYQVDSGDGDPATFFYYLGLAIRKASPKEKKPLPLLTAEYLADIRAFARRYFRELYSRLPRGSMLVLDNYQEVPLDSQFHGVVAEALLELPEGLNAVVVSRTEPPNQFARLLASDRLSSMEWQSLRLSMEETRAIAILRHAIDETTLCAIYAKSDGWAAGLTLMLERLKRHGLAPDAIEAEAREAVFNYFAGEIFDKAEPENQQILISTAFLPRVTVKMAEKLSGQASAGKLLDYLSRRHLFTERRLGKETTYHYHDLFRAFLLSKARETYTPAGQTQLASRAARLVEESGHAEDAIPLYLEAGDWARAIEAILGQAPTLLAQARAQTLRDWIARFPGEVSKSNPWLTYWQGASLVAAQPTHASEVLGTVFERFQDAGDELGQALTASGIIRAIYLEWADLTKIDPWIDVLRALIEKGLVFPSQEAELEAYTSAVIAIFNRRPADRFLRRASERAMELLSAPLDPNLKVTAGVALLLYYTTQPGGGHGKRVIELVQPSLESGSASPLNQMYWFTRVGLFWAHRGRYGASLQPIARGEAIAREGRAEFRSVVAFMPGIAYSVMTRDLRAAETRVEAMEESMTAGHILDECFLNVGQTYLLDIQGDLSRAADYALRAGNRATEGGMFFASVAMAVGAAALLACASRLDEALACVNDARKLIAGTFLAGCEFDLQLVEAHVALTQGDRAECGRLMRLAIPKLVAREFGFVRHTPRLKATLYAEALRQGIEPEQVQAMIREDRLQPPSIENEHWPWTVKVRALGDFRVEAEAIKSSGKSHYRLLEFVKALVALGGVGVNATTLTELLWPESEGDAAQRVFHTSLHRLRKLLGGESAIFLEDGKLSLNLELCWSDVTTFEFVAKQVEAVGNEQEATTEALVKFAERLMDLYRGPLLAQEDDKPWVLGSRDRLRSQFRRLVSRLAEGLEAKSEFELAISIYRNALERDNLSEDIYRRLMDCHQRRGEYAEGLNVYRRCRELLSVILGVQPSQQTQKLYAAIRLHA